MKTKVVQIIPSLDIGGAEKVCVNICNNIDKDKFDIYLISLQGIGALYDDLENHVKFINLKLPKKLTFPWVNLQTIIKFFNTIKDIKPSVIHSHLWGIYTIYLIPLFLFRKNKRVLTIHSEGAHYTSNKISSKVFRNIERIVYKYLHFNVVAISDGTFKLAKNFFKSKNPIIIPNGIKLPSNNEFNISVTNKKTPVIIHIGKYSSNKRQIDILYSIPLIKKKFPSVKVLFVGRNVESNLKNEVVKLNIIKNICFIGETNNVSKYLREANLGVFPSLYEGMPLSLLEMLSFGLPVVATEIPSVIELIRDHKWGELVPVKNPEKIAQAIIKIFSNENTYKNYSLSAKVIASNYSVERMTLNYCKMYLSASSKISY